ncbi:MAG: hypothetical protein AB7P69_00680 [Candidatus Binatia bacterium]
MAKKQTASGKGAALLEELKALAKQLGIRVREEKLLREVGYRVRGGSCRVHEQEMVFLDRDQPTSERIEILLDELTRRNVNTEQLSPSLRRLFSGGPAQ